MLRRQIVPVRHRRDHHTRRYRFRHDPPLLLLRPVPAPNDTVADFPTNNFGEFISVDHNDVHLAQSAKRGPFITPSARWGGETALMSIVNNARAQSYARPDERAGSRR